MKNITIFLLIQNAKYLIKFLRKLSNKNGSIFSYITIIILYKVPNTEKQSVKSNLVKVLAKNIH